MRIVPCPTSHLTPGSACIIAWRRRFAIAARRDRTPTLFDHFANSIHDSAWFNHIILPFSFFFTNLILSIRRPPLCPSANPVDSLRYTTLRLAVLCHPHSKSRIIDGWTVWLDNSPLFFPLFVRNDQTRPVLRHPTSSPWFSALLRLCTRVHIRRRSFDLCRVLPHHPSCPEAYVPSSTMRST